MIFDIRVILNTVILGLMTLMFGLKENKNWKIYIGSLLTSAGIILNTISALNGG